MPAKISYEMRNQGLKAYQNGKPDIHESDFKLLEDVSNVYKTIAQNDVKNWTVVDEIKPDGMRMNPDQVFDCIRPILNRFIEHTK